MCSGFARPTHEAKASYKHFQRLGMHFKIKVFRSDAIFGSPKTFFLVNYGNLTHNSDPFLAVASLLCADLKHFLRIA